MNILLLAFNNGVLLQWQKTDPISKNTYKTYTFPIVYTNVYGILLLHLGNDTNVWLANYLSIDQYTNVGFSLHYPSGAKKGTFFLSIGS